MRPYLDFKPEVAQALAQGKPVVALESTIISHGMPYPQNVETAREVEALIRAEGAVPATIGILKGRVKIGLTDTELENFGRAKDVEKVSRRDFPLVLAAQKDGATTVAGTMVAAQWAGIKVFVTGGLGGVHRGVRDTWDISADLTELQQTSVAVVCAGVKSILDIAKTLEVLETSGVPVIGYGCDEFPAFFTRTSGHPVLKRMDSLEAIAHVLAIKEVMQLSGGLVVANPIPVADALAPDVIQIVLDEALAAAANAGIAGKKITPYLLASIAERTGGASLKANIALVKNNAHVGAQLAVAYAMERRKGHGP